MKNERQELMELKHEPHPGYGTAFTIAVLIGIAYLAFIFFSA